MATSKRCWPAPARSSRRSAARRSSTTPNRRAFRSSWSTLDRMSPLDVPLEDLVVPSPTASDLIAFLKAMEFPTLTRRVAEAAASMPPQVEPDPRSRRSPAGDGAARRHRPAATDAAGARARWHAEVPEAAPSRGTPSTAALRARRRPRALPCRPFDLRDRPPLDRLKAWIARARRGGVVAFDTETTCPIRCRRELCGISLAIAPGEACYVPLGHRDERRDLFGAGLDAPTRFPMRDALARSSRCWRTRRPQGRRRTSNTTGWCSRSAASRSRGYDDTMLISYVLDAGKGGHGMDELAKRWLDHDTIHFEHVAGTGKAQITFDCVADRQGDRLRRRGCRRHAAAVDRAASRASSPSMSPPSTRRWSEPMSPVLARMERRGISIDRQILRGSPTNSRRSRRARGRDPGARRRAVQSRLARSSSATFCSARWACPAARRPRPGNGRPARANSRTWPSRATSCRARSSTGGRCRS